MNDPFVGSLTFARVYSGTVAECSICELRLREERSDWSHVLMHSNNREEIKECTRAIYCPGWSEGHDTGDTLCDPAIPVFWSDGVPRSGY